MTHYVHHLLPAFLILTSEKTDMKRMIILLLLIVLSPVMALAHDGHGHTHGFTIQHYFVEPEHLLTLIIVLGSGILYFHHCYKKKKEQKKV